MQKIWIFAGFIGLIVFALFIWFFIGGFTGFADILSDKAEKIVDDEDHEVILLKNLVLEDLYEYDASDISFNSWNIQDDAAYVNVSLSIAPGVCQGYYYSFFKTEDIWMIFTEETTNC